jgi:hypothetical protein
MKVLSVLLNFLLQCSVELFVYRNQLRMAFCQIVHHRAQLGVFLRLLDIPIPGSYGPSADENNFA